MLTYDFSEIDAVSRLIYKKDSCSESFTQLNPTGMFLATKTSITVKVEDHSKFNHVVVSISEKEITVRPGVRAH